MPFHFPWHRDPEAVRERTEEHERIADEVSRIAREQQEIKDRIRIIETRIALLRRREQIGE